MFFDNKTLILDESQQQQTNKATVGAACRNLLFLQQNFSIFGFFCTFALFESFLDLFAVVPLYVSNANKEF